MMEYEIKEALEQKGCPICNVVKNSLEKSLWWFFTENYHDISTLEILAKNPAICDIHAETLRTLGDNFLSVTFQFLVNNDINKLKEMKKNINPGGFFKLKSRFKNPIINILSGASKSIIQKKIKKVITRQFDKNIECKFCKTSRDFSIFAAMVFVKLLQNEPDFRTKYIQSDGLCRKHFVQVLELCSDSASLDFLAGDMIRRLENIKQDFELFFHKLDYRFSDEPKGEEQKAWIKALNYYSSNYSSNAAFK